jgi:hypothetical protein
MPACQPETRLQNEIRVAVSAECPQATLFRNHCGALKDQRGKMLKFGLSPGSPDLVGWRSVAVTADMVGQQLAVFVGIEVKMPGEKPRQDQQHWLDMLDSAGGIAGVATSESEAIDLLSLHELHELQT